MNSYVWIKLVSPEETSWTRVSLSNVEFIDDLKAVIKNKKPVDLKDYDADKLILKAKKKADGNEQAVELDDPRESVASIQQRFGADFEVLVSVPAGMYVPNEIFLIIFTLIATCMSSD